jgi:hypothetical protein
MSTKELENADVSFISLVKRPANRMPFRITKSENLNNQDGSTFMFNLSSVLKGNKDEVIKSTPSVAALAIKKQDADKLLPVLVEKGFKTDDQIERDDVLILKQESEFDEADLVAFKMDDNVVAMVTNVKKMFHTLTDSMSFADNIASQGFMPGIFVATDALIETFHNILFGSDNSTDVRMKMQTAIAEYSNFVTSMAENLPEMVFKLEPDHKETVIEATIKDESEDDINKTAKTSENVKSTDTVSKGDAETDGNADEVQEKDTTTETEEVADAGTQVAKTDDVDKTAADEAAQITQAMKGDIDEEILNPSVTKGEDESGVKTETTDKVEDKSTVSKSGDNEVAKGLMTMLTAIQKQLDEGIAGVNDKLENVEKSTSKLSDRLDTVEEVAKSAEKAVKGTVLSGSDSIVHSEGLGNQTRTMKNEVDRADEDLWGDTALDKIVG